MSLVVWLPLTKDLRQQGLSNVTVTNNGATFNSAGKLGGCYSFNGSNNNLAYTPSIDGLEVFSIAMWLCPSTSTPTGAFFSLERDTYWQITFKGAVVGIRDNSIGWNGTRKDYSSGTYAANVWTHLVVTYNKGTLKIYRDGVLLSTNTVGGTKLNTGINNARIGSAVQDGYYYSGKINDVRFYDHCLSPMEVKELAKGLILHYPLNRNGWGQENLATCTTPQYNLSASTVNYNYFWIASKDTLTIGETYTVSAEVTVSDNIESCTIYNYHTNPITSGPRYNYFPADGKRHSWTFTATATGLLGYCGVAGATANHTAIYKNIKIEKGSIATPYIPRGNETLYTTMGLNEITEYDCSGFCNNGIKNNLPTYSSDTAKYAISTHVDGVNQTIQLPNLSTLIPDSIFTFNIWFKRLASEPGSKAWETILGGPSGFEIETCSANNVHDNKIRAYSWGSGMFEFELDKWNMLTMVSNGANALFYLNGELKLTGTYKALVSGNYFLGSWRDTATQNYRGYMCDARIYATALSADDVKSLYQNCATIDPDGTIRGQIRS